MSDSPQEGDLFVVAEIMSQSFAQDRADRRPTTFCCGVEFGHRERSIGPLSVVGVGNDAFGRGFDRQHGVSHHHRYWWYGHVPISGFVTVTALQECDAVA